MTESLVFGKQGYKDWKRTSQSIPRHKKSAVHREAMIKLLQRSDAGCVLMRNWLDKPMRSAIIGILCLNG
jgi:hypothetical protein